MSLVLQKASPTGTRATQVIGVATILVMAWVVVSGLIFTPQDVVQGESVRIMYVHVPSAWIACQSRAASCAVAGRVATMKVRHVEGGSKTTLCAAASISRSAFSAACAAECPGLPCAC